jgi:hypothetical protein
VILRYITAHKDSVNSNLKYKNLKIMKKSIFAIGLLSLVMVLTSFTTTETTKVSINNNTTLQAAGSGGTVGGTGTPKLDAAGSGGTIGGKGTPKLDAAGSGGTIGGKGTPKLD